MSATTPHRFVRSRKERDESRAVWARLVAMLLGGLFLFLGTLLALSLGYSLLYFGRIFPGVSVAGVDLSGLSPVDAANRLNSTLTYPYSGRVVFHDGTNLWVETPAKLGMVLDAESTAKEALQFGREGNLFQNIADRLAAVQSGADLSPVSIYDERVAQQYLQGLASKIDHPVQEANLRLNGVDIVAQPGQPGRALNVDATLVYLSVQLQSYRDGEVPLVIIEQIPEIMDSSAQAEAARRLLSAPLTLSIPNAQAGDPGPWQIQPGDLAGMLRVGRARTGAGSQFVVQVDRDALQKLLDGIAKSINRRSENARFVFNDKTGQLDLVQSAVIGLTMDVPASLEAVENAVALGQQNVDLKVGANQPAVGDDSTAQQLGITQLIQSQTTYFYGSTAARMQNIKTAAARFHGVLVAPGQTFSMGDYLGDISLDNGFAEAMIIYNGQTIKGVGGGVCQVSTTLFRTAFFAGFRINERHAHAYRVYYYEQRPNGANDSALAGLDATVYFPLVDFKFTNDTPYWLLMETYFNPASYSLTWKFYSTADGRTVNWETTGPQNIIPAPKPVIQINPEFSPGEYKQVDYAADGASVVVNRVVMRDGKILFVDKFQTNYEPWAAVCEYGPGTKNADKIFKRNGLCQS